MNWRPLALDFLFLFTGRTSFRRFKCRECEDTGMASYEDWVGFRGYAVCDDCRSCEIGERRRRERRERNAEHYLEKSARTVSAQKQPTPTITNENESGAKGG